MSRTMIAALTLAAVAACGGGDRRDAATADSLSRDLQLAPVDTSAELNDRPTEDRPAARAPATAPARTPPSRTATRPAAPSRPAASAPAPAAAPTARSLAAGT